MRPQEGSLPGKSDVLQGTLCQALVRLEQRGWIKSAWGVSDNGRRARFYNLTKAGRRQLRAETESWRKTSTIMAKFLEVDGA